MKAAPNGRKRSAPNVERRYTLRIVGEEPKVYSVRVGTVRQRAELAPRVQLWSRSAQHWVTSIASVPKHETQPALNSAGGLE